VNGAELYFLGRKLMAIAGDALPGDSVLRRISPAALLVLEDAARHPGTSAGETAERTGLLPGQVAVLVAAMAAEGFVETAEDRITVGRALLFRGDTASPADEALAAALDTADAGEVRDVADTLKKVARRLGAGTFLRAAADFDAAYRGTPPWEIGHPQPALAELAELGAIRGRVLDVGCGSGEHALMAASLGLPAAGIDTSPAAIEIARRKAAERNLTVRFTVHDALDLGALAEQFDTVIDSALFHVFGDDDRLRYAAGLRQVLPPGGRYFMLCFSDRQPPGFGPRRVRREEIEAIFGDGWRIDEIQPATLEVTRDPAGVRAWRAAITRV
jgi:SAM-dependent methyltransferase/DNA-binding MarR family transcriptional regulator